MRQSEMAERYAQRAIDKRKELEARQRGERRLGDYALTAYLAEGEHLDAGLRSIPIEERYRFIMQNSELITSPDGAEGVHIVWCPHTAVLTHRLLSPELRRELGNKHYLKTWTRQLHGLSRESLRLSTSKMLEVRAELRAERAKQGHLALDLPEEEIHAEAPQFLVAGNTAYKRV
ncbi:TPA: hypothetical protein NIA45_006917 [Pseudomonas aeruginosa]|nr:hypothetical protein [Pseudomonas aeruginosa]